MKTGVLHKMLVVGYLTEYRVGGERREEREERRGERREERITFSKAIDNLNAVLGFVRRSSTFAIVP
jgi:hypothetical protein